MIWANLQLPHQTHSDHPFEPASPLLSFPREACYLRHFACAFVPVVCALFPYVSSVLNHHSSDPRYLEAHRTSVCRASSLLESQVVGDQHRWQQSSRRSPDAPVMNPALVVRSWLRGNGHRVLYVSEKIRLHLPAPFFSVVPYLKHFGAMSYHVAL